MSGKARDRKRTGARFSKVPTMNEPVKLLLFTFKFEVSNVLKVI